jgi:hypothetical protein
VGRVAELGSLGHFERVKNPVHDFGHGSRIVEMTISRYSEADTPTVHRRLTVTIESAASRRHFAFINPEPLADLSGLMDARAFRIIDRNREGESGIEFGRYWLEYRDDDDTDPRHIQADRFEELKDYETVA